MADFNKVILMGRLVADPELRTTPNGISVTSFRIGVNRRVGRDAQPVADFFDIVAWRNTAEFVCKYFSKGKPILVCGSLQTRNWEDKDGAKRRSVEVVADEANFVESKNASSGMEAPSRGTGGNMPSQYSSTYEDSPKFEEISPEDDFPF